MFTLVQHFTGQEKMLMNLWKAKGFIQMIIKQCSSEKETFLIYGFARPLYNVLEYEVGRGHHAYGTTIYTKKRKKSLQVTIKWDLCLYRYEWQN